MNECRRRYARARGPLAFDGLPGELCIAAARSCRHSADLRNDGSPAAVAPKLPAILHNELEGSYDVRFVVGVDGRTRDIHVHANNLRPIGRSHGQPVGYDEAVLAAVRQWQYAKQPRPCHVSTSVQINYQDASGEMSN